MFVSGAEQILEQNNRVISKFSCFINRRLPPNQHNGTRTNVSSVVNSPISKKIDKIDNNAYTSKYSTDSKGARQAKAPSNARETWYTDKAEHTLPDKSLNGESYYNPANVTPSKSQMQTKPSFFFNDTTHLNTKSREACWRHMKSSDVLDPATFYGVSEKHTGANQGSKVVYNSSSKCKQHSKKYSIPDLSYLSPQTKQLSPLERFLHELSIKKWKMKSSSKHSNNY